MHAQRAGLLALQGFALLIAALQLVPLIVVALVSVSRSPVFDLPYGGLSWRWYERLLSIGGFWNSIVLSSEIAAISTAVAIVLGTLFALGVASGRVPGAGVLTTCLLSPLMLPGLVLGIAMLNAFRLYGLRQAYAALLVAHVAVTMPFVVRVVLAALQRFDTTLLDAARTLGRSYAGAIRTVLIPNLLQPIATGGVFAFIASFDNYPVSIFLVDARTKTLPIRMLQVIDEAVDPTLAAASTLLLVLSLLAVLVAHRLGATLLDAG